MTKLLTSEREIAGSEQVRKAKAPKYAALAGYMREQILARELKVGDRLPSFTELRREYGATPTTVERVYSLLEQEGLVERRQGVGTFVKHTQRKLTGNIGFIGRALMKRRQSPFHGHIVEGVQQAIEARQFHLLYLGTEHSLKVEACEKVDGVLLCNIEDTENAVQYLPDRLPRVSLLNIAKGMTSVVADDHGGARLAVQHLLKKGHRRIACLLEESPSLAQRRFAGYNAALQEADIDADPRWARLTETLTPHNAGENMYLEWGRAQMSAWLQDGWDKTGCTAIFVQNDLSAIGVMQTLQEAGIRVPQQMSVIGFDGTEMCDLTVPRLTAVELPLAQIGGKAVEALERQIRGEQMETQVVTLPMELRGGDSVASPS